MLRSPTYPRTSSPTLPTLVFPTIRFARILPLSSPTLLYPPHTYPLIPYHTYPLPYHISLGDLGAEKSPSFPSPTLDYLIQLLCPPLPYTILPSPNPFLPSTPFPYPTTLLYPPPNFFPYSLLPSILFHHPIPSLYPSADISYPPISPPPSLLFPPSPPLGSPTLLSRPYLTILSPLLPFPCIPSHY